MDVECVCGGAVSRQVFIENNKELVVVSCGCGKKKIKYYRTIKYKIGDCLRHKSTNRLFKIISISVQNNRLLYGLLSEEPESLILMSQRYDLDIDWVTVCF